MHNNQLLPYITIVMPVFNEERFIEQTLQQLLSQEYPVERIEILVIDGMSVDNTREIVNKISKQYDNIHLLDNPKRKSSAGRNIGFKKGQGDYFLVVDGHCFIPDNKLITNLVECFLVSGADCLGRPQPLDPPGLSTFQEAVGLARGSKFGHGGDSLIYANYEGFASPVSNGAAYSRKVFEEVGYVDENFDACEDVEFNYRVEQAGLTCYTSPKLTILYFPRKNLKNLFQQLASYGEGRFRLIKKHRKALTFNQIIPTLFVLGILLNLLIFILSPTIIDLHATKRIISIPYIIYLMLILFESIRLSIPRVSKYFLILPCIFICIHTALGWGFIRGTFLGVGK